MISHLLSAEAALTGLRAEEIGALLASAADVVLVLDGDDVIEALACNLDRGLNQALEQWRGSMLKDRVEPGSRAALRGMLNAARGRRHGLRQLLRHPVAGHDDVPVAYTAQAVGDEGRVILLGRDQRELLQLQARVVSERSAVERQRRELQRDEPRQATPTLTPTQVAAPAREPALEARLVALLEQLDDAIVLTDSRGVIAWHNACFLRMLGREDDTALAGQPLADHLHCQSLALESVLARVRLHGGAQRLRGALRGRAGLRGEVWISITSTTTGARADLGVVLRVADAQAPSALTLDDDLFRSAEQLGALVGKVPMKGMVRDATDKVEKMCIEAALRLTGNNRALAAKVLGLSRQGLYQKLHLYQLIDADDAPPEDLDAP